MIIFLGIVGELATVIGSVAIMFNGLFNSLLEISKNGYKIPKSVMDEALKEYAKEQNKKISLVNRVLGTILLLTPGVNLINASIKGAKLKKALINDPQVKEAIIPMTEQEKEQYANMKGKLQKIIFTALTTGQENEEEEFFGFIGNRPIVVDHGLSSIRYEELIPLNYTLDEVKKLNEATSFSYRIGKIDGKNVAVIGIPNPDSPLSRIQFKEEDYKITHTYEKMTEEEAQDKTFAVYPFTINGGVEKVVQEIKQSRIESEQTTNSSDLQVYSEAPGVEIGYAKSDVPLEDMMCCMEDSIFDDSTQEQGQGPILKKELTPQRKTK